LFGRPNRMADPMNKLFAAILVDNASAVKKLLTADAGLATSLVRTAKLYDAKIFHWIYVGDTALHLAAAGYRVEIVRILLAAGADPNAARNHRRSSPLHYAADANHWDPDAQADTIAYLISAGADPNALDKSGVGPLHRAVRTRSLPAVRALLDGGANPRLPNGSGSTPHDLAIHDTGRSGSGSTLARGQQARILDLLAERSVH